MLWVYIISGKTRAARKHALQDSYFNVKSTPFSNKSMAILGMSASITCINEFSVYYFEFNMQNS